MRAKGSGAPADKRGPLPPTSFIIFGGGGDLSWRKLMPALFDLFRAGSLPAQFTILAVDRAAFSDVELRRRYLDGVRKYSRQPSMQAAVWKDFARHIHYLPGDFKDPGLYQGLRAVLTRQEGAWGGKGQRIFYMATPPSLFAVIPVFLGEAGLAKDKGSSRIVVEKPIGHDLSSARALNAVLWKHFEEPQIFRIDHYLGKETVQNILAFRFANPLFEPLWNRRYVDYVTITAAEALGVGHRGAYYEGAGALRDMVQNHLMQLFCLVAMEPMVSFDADEIRNKKVDVLHAIRPIQRAAVSSCAVRGQYGPGRGRRGYRQEAQVRAGSRTETYAALKLYVDNWRWQGVPFYLRTGKRLPRQFSEVAVHFRAVPHESFPPESGRDWPPARLSLSIHPEEGIILDFQAKYPGAAMLLRPVQMDFSYQKSFAKASPEAYETLLWDIMKNDPTLFMRSDQVEAAWKAIAPVLEAWAREKPGRFPDYKAGTWGPKGAEALLAQDGHRWGDKA